MLSVASKHFYSLEKEENDSAQRLWQAMYAKYCEQELFTVESIEERKSIETSNFSYL